MDGVLTAESPVPGLRQAPGFTCRHIHSLNPRHTRDIDHPPGKLRIRPLPKQRLQLHRHIENTLHIEIIQLIPRMLGVIIVIIAPASSSVIDKHRQPIHALLQLVAHSETAGFVFEVPDDVAAFSWTQGVEARGGGLEFFLLARGDEHGGPVLNEGLRGHFAQACCAARYEGDVGGEVVEGGDAQVVGGGGVRHFVW